MNKILSLTENEFIINTKVKRHDYITRTFIKIIDSNYFSNGLKWFTYTVILRIRKENNI